MTTNFYDDWLGLWDKSEREKKAARKVIHAEELRWVSTRQDHKAALMVAPETGFRTWGGITMIAEIPLGWHTGSHSHGEEAIYIMKGKGFSIIDDKAYDWEEGSCIRIPFGSVHQHFNEGAEPVQYTSAMAPHLEHLCGLAKFEQYRRMRRNQWDHFSSKVLRIRSRCLGHASSVAPERDGDFLRLATACKCSKHSFYRIHAGRGARSHVRQGEGQRDAQDHYQPHGVTA